ASIYAVSGVEIVFDDQSILRAERAGEEDQLRHLDLGGITAGVHRRNATDATPARAIGVSNLYVHRHALPRAAHHRGHAVAIDGDVPRHARGDGADDLPLVVGRDVLQRGARVVAEAGEDIHHRRGVAARGIE